MCGLKSYSLVLFMTGAGESVFGPNVDLGKSYFNLQLYLSPWAKKNFRIGCKVYYLAGAHVLTLLVLAYFHEGEYWGGEEADLLPPNICT